MLLRCCVMLTDISLCGKKGRKGAPSWDLSFLPVIHRNPFPRRLARSCSDTMAWNGRELRQCFIQSLPILCSYAIFSSPLCHRHLSWPILSWERVKREGRERHGEGREICSRNVFLPEAFWHSFSLSVGSSSLLHQWVALGRNDVILGNHCHEANSQLR